MSVAYPAPARRLNDLSLDLQLAGVARGDLLYRGVSKWQNRPIGANGQVLTSDGTEPVWAAPTGGGDLSAAVILAPADSARNVVRPTADAVALTLRPFVDNGQPILDFRTAQGLGSLWQFTGSGHLVSSANRQFWLSGKAGINLDPALNSFDLTVKQGAAGTYPLVLRNTVDDNLLYCRNDGVLWVAKGLDVASAGGVSYFRDSLQFTAGHLGTWSGDLQLRPGAGSPDGTAGVHVQPAGAAAHLLTLQAVAAQAGDPLRILADGGGTLLRVYPSGRVILGAPNSAPTDGDLPNNAVSIHQDGANLLFRVRKGDGTYATATVALA